MQLLVKFFIISCFSLLQFSYAETLFDDYLLKNKLSTNEKMLRKFSNQLNFSSFVIYDKESKVVLDKKKGELDVVSDVYRRLMFLYIIFDNIKSDKLAFDDKLRIPYKFPDNLKKDKFKLEVGDKIKVSKLIDMVVYSGSERAMFILLRKISGSVNSFVSLMNIYSGDIGNHQTVFKSIFKNSARDLKISVDDILNIVLSFYKKFSNYIDILNKKEVKIQGNKYLNKNVFMRQNLDGLLIEKFYDDLYYGVLRLKKHGREFYIIVNGAEFSNVNKRLLNYIDILQKTHKNKLLYKKGDVVKKVEVLNGEKMFADVIVNKNIYYTKFFGDSSNIDIKIEYKMPLKAPFNGGKVGKIIINNNGNFVEYDLIVEGEIRRAGLLKKFVNYFNIFVDYIIGLWNVYSF